MLALPRLLRPLRNFAAKKHQGESKIGPLVQIVDNCAARGFLITEFSLSGKVSEEGQCLGGRFLPNAI
jgi:hypothetical protein